MRDKILKYIEKHKTAKGFAPSQSAIAAGLNTSRQRIGYHFKDLADKLSDVAKYPEYARFFTNDKAKKE